MKKARLNAGEEGSPCQQPWLRLRGAAAGEPAGEPALKELLLQLAAGPSVGSFQNVHSSQRPISFPRQKPPPRTGHLPVRLGRHRAGGGRARGNPGALLPSPRWQKLRREVRRPQPSPGSGGLLGGGKERRGGSCGPPAQPSPVSGKARSGVAVSKQRLSMCQPVPPVPGSGFPCRDGASPAASRRRGGPGGGLAGRWLGNGCGSLGAPRGRASRRAGNGGRARGGARLMRAAPGLHPP